MTDREILLQLAYDIERGGHDPDFTQYIGLLRMIAVRMEGEVDSQIARCREQRADLRELIGVLGQRLTIVEARPIVGIGPDSPRVYDGSLVEAFNELYKKGEASNEDHQ